MRMRLLTAWMICGLGVLVQAEETSTADKPAASRPAANATVTSAADTSVKAKPLADKARSTALLKVKSRSTTWCSTSRKVASMTRRC